MYLNIKQFFTKKYPYDAEVEYIESTTRGPFINTEICGNYNSTIKARFYVSNATTTWQSPFGGDQNTDGTTPSSTLNLSLYRNSSARFGFSANYGLKGSFRDTSNLVKFLVGWYEVTFSLPNRKLTINGYNFNIPNTDTISGQMRYPIPLFTKWRFVSNNPSYDWIAACNGSGSYCKLIGRFAWYKLYDGDELIQDLIPVRFRNENKIPEGGMFDKLTGKILRNVGTGSFTIGPDIQ